jgi:hypothetical protein
MKRLALVLLIPAFAFMTGCGEKDEHAGHDHAAGKGDDHDVHTAKMGGQLVEVGSHEFNIELLRDSASGKITLWVLDAHAENFVRVTNETVAISVSPDGKDEAVVLKATANTATGEKLGSTSQFEGQSDAFKTAKPLAVRIPTLQIGAKQYSGLSVDLKK